MPELPTPDRKLRVTDIVDKHTHEMMAALDELHTEYLIPDAEIIGVLRESGYGHEADLYQDWIADEDPPRHVDEGDPEGPGQGVVPDPPNPSYEPLVDQLQAQREATSITYEWTERERMIFSCKATVNRSQLQTWLNAHWPHLEVEDLDAEVLVDFLEAEYSAVSNESRLPADSDEIDYYDLKIVEPDLSRRAEAFQMLREANNVPPTVEQR